MTLFSLVLSRKTKYTDSNQNTITRGAAWQVTIHHLVGTQGTFPDRLLYIYCKYWLTSLRVHAHNQPDDSWMTCSYIFPGCIVSSGKPQDSNVGGSEKYRAGQCCQLSRVCAVYRGWPTGFGGYGSARGDPQLFGGECRCVPNHPAVTCTLCTKVIHFLSPIWNTIPWNR